MADPWQDASETWPELDLTELDLPFDNWTGWAIDPALANGADVYDLPSHGPPSTGSAYMTAASSLPTASPISEVVSPLQQIAVVKTNRPERKAAVKKPKVSKPARVATTKASASKSQQSGGRNKQGQAVTQTPKPFRARLIKACWRCRKYKKQCDEGPVCTSCLTSGFRVWPSELGCRRERLNSMADCYLPNNFEVSLMHILPGTWKSPSWRRLRAPDGAPSHNQKFEGDATTSWAQVRKQLRSIKLFGDDLDGFIDIAETYQMARKKPDNCLENACELLALTSQLYNCFVSVEGADSIIPPVHEVAQLVTRVRVSLQRSFNLVERLCLSCKSENWFAATLSVSFLTCAAVVFIDTILAVPEIPRAMIWGDHVSRREWMRHGSYGMLVAFLRASTKGVNPLKLETFSAQDVTALDEKPDLDLHKANLKYKETLLPPIDTPSLTGGRQLNGWVRRHQMAMHKAMQMLQMNVTQTFEIPPIGGLVKVYDW